MGREVRRVPAYWQHPADEKGAFIPLFDGAQYKHDIENWEEDEVPKRSDYMPLWTEVEATHLMMYETCSEGTPISPAFETPEELARWLADNGASAFGSMTAPYEAWLKVAKGGFAPSAVIVNGALRSGVEAMADE